MRRYSAIVQMLTMICLILTFACAVSLRIKHKGYGHNHQHNKGFLGMERVDYLGSLKKKMDELHQDGDGYYWFIFILIILSNPIYIFLLPVFLLQLAFAQIRCIFVPA